MNILIVEDDILQATNLKILLSRYTSANIQLLHSGKEVAPLCAKQQIDLMFCDLNLPGLNGIDLLSSLSEAQRPTGVVILSAANKDVVDITYSMCVSAGYCFVRSLVKPVAVGTLEDILSDFKAIASPSDSGKQMVSLSVEDINQGFNQGWFRNYYQPQYQVSNNKIIGVEALIRCEHPTHGMLGPNAFLSAMTKHNMLDKLFWVSLETALSDLSRFDNQLLLSINMNQKTLQTPMSEQLLEFCERSQFAVERLTLELTEDEVYNSCVISLANLANLRLRGVGLAIDDFGTGYSSLSQLATLPFTELKIDQKFIGNAVQNYKSRQLIAACVQLATSLGLRSVAEGVEDHATLTYLNEIGVDLFQGYIASKPLPISQLIELL
jgi:EAL domain-containing protein (putative c-di-GMP-specific phosphodiesterase class I)